MIFTTMGSKVVAGDEPIIIMISDKLINIHHIITVWYSFFSYTNPNIMEIKWEMKWERKRDRDGDSRKGQVADCWIFF